MVSNNVTLIGRLTADPTIRYTQGDNSTAVARFTLAVDRRRGNDGGADFINCLSFGKTAEFAEKYFHKGIKIAIRGHIQTGSYTNKDGNKVYTTDVVIDEQEFAESKSNGGAGDGAPVEKPSAVGGGFMYVPDGIEDDGLPFN